MHLPSRACLTLFAVFLLSACGQQAQSPSDVYLAYHERSAQAMSFDEESSYFSARQQAGIDEKIASMVERTGKSHDEITSLYLKVSQDTAKCSTLSLVEERIEGDNAFLVFDATGNCPETPTSDSRHEVTLVQENGWKFDEVEIIF